MGDVVKQKLVVGYVVGMHVLRAVGPSRKMAAWNVKSETRRRVWVFATEHDAERWIIERRNHFPQVAKAPYVVIPIVKHEPSNVDPAPQG